MTTLSSFITSLATSALAFIALMILYTVLSRMSINRVIYYPARILRGKDTREAKRFRRPWEWMWEAYIAKQEHIIEVAGLDAAVYLYLHKTALQIMLLSSIFLLPALIPLAVTGGNLSGSSNGTTATNTTKLDDLGMSNVKEKSPRIWAFLVGMYIVSFVIFFVLNRTYKAVVFMRAEAQGRSKAEPEQFACLVQDIPKPPKDESRSTQVDNFFRLVHPETYEKALIVTKLKKPSKLWKKLEKAKAKLAHAEAELELSKLSKAHPDGVRPRHKTGKFGLYGRKVDSIDHWTEQIKELPTTLEKEQALTKEANQQGAAVIFFNSRRGAAEASQESHSPFADRWQVLPAPEPRAVIWENMHIGFYSRLVREPFVYFIVFLTIVFYMIPIGFIAAISTLSTLTHYLPFIKPIVKIGVLKTVIEAYLPQLALILFLALLPTFLLYLSKAEGIVSKAKLERAACGKMYYFVVFNVFIGFSILGTAATSLQSVNELKEAGSLSFNGLIDLFGSSLPPNASYFITYVALRFFVGYGLELSRLFPLVLYHLKKKYMCKTEDELKDAWAPGPFTYLPNIPNDLLVVTITIAYAVIAPLIIPFAFLYFGIGWLVWRNQALNVYVPAYESGGRFWPHIHSRFLVGLFVSQITAAGYFLIKKFAFFFFLIPLPFITLWYAYVTHKVYYPSFRHVSVSAASREVTDVPPLSSIVDAFTPSCLLPPDEAGSEHGKSLSKHDKLPRSTSYVDSESQLSSSNSSNRIVAHDDDAHTQSARNSLGRGDFHTDN